MSEICIFGAGSIGCYVGGRLAASGAQVQFIGRPRMAAQIASSGLRLSDYLGADLHVASDQVSYATEAQAARGARLLLITVKSAATAEAAQLLAPILDPNCVVVSLQNGLHNAEVLALHLPNHTVVAGMVPFNVVSQGNGHFHQGSEGQLEVAKSTLLAPFLKDFAKAGLPLQQHPDMPAVLWAKLILNLNNAINALSGKPLKEELSQRAYRRVLAACQAETLDLLKASGIKPARIGAVPVRWLPQLLNVPDWLFQRLAQSMLRIDPLARSSMWEDLELGRQTEIDYLNGEVVTCAQALGRAVPANEKICALIHAAEQGGRRDWSGDELLTQISGSSS